MRISLTPMLARIWRRGGDSPRQVKKLQENPSNSLISKRLSKVDLQRITARCSPRKPGFYPKCVISVIRNGRTGIKVYKTESSDPLLVQWGSLDAKGTVMQ